MNIRTEEIQAARSRTIGSEAISHAARLAPLAILGFVILFALHETSSVVAPMFAAIVVGVVLSRLGDRANEIGVPPYVSATLAVLGTGVALVLAAGALTSRLSSLIDRGPALAARFNSLAAEYLRPLQAIRTQLFGPSGERASPSFDLSAVTGALGGLTPALGGILIFLATLFFFVVAKADLRKKVILLPRSREGRLSALRILNGVEEALAHYFGSAALIYAALAIVTALLAWMTGLGSPLLWGVFVFVAGFVPFLGVTLVTVAMMAAGITTHENLLAGLAPAAIYVIAHLLLENVLLPAVVGRRFEVNAFLVFVSIVFWTWIWGALGAVIASPMLLILKILRDELRAQDKPDLPN